MKLRARGLSKYGQRVLRPGDSFEANDKDARFLTTIGLAEIDETEEPVVDEVFIEVAPPKKRGRPKGSYKRRDMVAK